MTTLPAVENRTPYMLVEKGMTDAGGDANPRDEKISR
jgi:hypothetical protein